MSEAAEDVLSVSLRPTSVSCYLLHHYPGALIFVGLLPAAAAWLILPDLERDTCFTSDEENGIDDSGVQMNPFVRDSIGSIIEEDEEDEEGTSTAKHGNSDSECTPERSSLASPPAPIRVTAVEVGAVFEGANPLHAHATRALQVHVPAGDMQANL